MFTGIITDIGKVETIKNVGNSDIEITLTITDASDVFIGESIANNGVCLTVTAIKHNSLTFYLSKETIDCSNFSEVKVGNLINIERSLKLSDGLSGHIVSGHVDFVAKVLEITQIENSYIFNISFTPEYSLYFIDKGSVTINGISLTVNKVVDNYFTVNIIPHTYQNTNLKSLKAGDSVNIETDVIAKYVVKASNVYTK